MNQKHKNNLTLLFQKRSATNVSFNSSRNNRASESDVSFQRQKTENDEDLLTSSFFLFLSLIHQNQELLKIFRQNSNSQASFIDLYEKKQFPLLLQQVFHIFNASCKIHFQDSLKVQNEHDPFKILQVSMDHKSQASKKQSVHQEPQKSQSPRPNLLKQPNLQNLQEAIIGMIKKDLSPLKNEIIRNKNLAQISFHKVLEIPAQQIKIKNFLIDRKPLDKFLSQDISPILNQSCLDSPDYKSISQLLRKISDSPKHSPKQSMFKKQYQVITKKQSEQKKETESIKMQIQQPIQSLTTEKQINQQNNQFKLKRKGTSYEFESLTNVLNQTLIVSDYGELQDQTNTPSIHNSIIEL